MLLCYMDLMLSNILGLHDGASQRLSHNVSFVDLDQS